MPVGGSLPAPNGAITRVAGDQFRVVGLQVDMSDPIVLQAGQPVRQVDISMGPHGPVLAALAEDGTLHIKSVKQRRNLMTGKVAETLSGGQVALAAADRAVPPAWLMLAGLGDNLYLIWKDGKFLRYDTRDTSAPVLAERLDLTPEPDVEVTAAAFLIGKTSLVFGDSRGRIRVWFRTRTGDTTAADGLALTLAHDLPPGAAAVSALAPSSRTRMLAAAFRDGSAALYHVTSGRRLLSLHDAAPAGGGAGVMAMAPKDDALLALSERGLMPWRLDVPHPETSWAAIFRPVWYEGDPRPMHVWQSSSGTDDFEPKFGLIPLIFGTLKATVYAMLFALPLALLAAVYSSEIMHPRTRARVKPVIEMMASLPSVVLGFLAALVIAPAVENRVPEVLAGLVTVPLAVLLGGHLWQTLPRGALSRIRRYRMVAMAAALAIGLALAWPIGALAERLLFAGDIKVWLDGQKGTGLGGWFLITLPTAALAVAAIHAGLLAPWLRRRQARVSARGVAGIALLRFGALAVLALAMAWGAAALLTQGPFGLWHWDPRGAFMGTYVQRNALVVGFLMGFAIIPILYTLADDALSAVPEHLRSASLACGATSWQTAMRVVVPTAASGIFSAIMIALGRAVGETMIVLMAAGNTPVLDWNIFNGFRTLAANIAVELPEAVRHSTHYRMLFLAALALFAMTFCLNTAAEIVRQRFRKRAFEL
jgi:phosphate transport system permease protein